jgi:hypothetical protein
MIIGPANTAAVSTLDGLSVAGSLQVQGTNVMTELAGKVAKTDADYTNAVALAAGALPKSGGTMTGDLVFTNGAGINTGGGVFVLDTVGGEIQTGSGCSISFQAGGEQTSLVKFGNGDDERWGSIAAWSSVIVLDVSGTGWLTNGTWHVSGTATNGTEIMNYQATAAMLSSATATPTPLSYVTNLTISAANGIEQRITEITGAMDITFPIGLTNMATRIFLTIPPYSGTNAVRLIAGPSYTFVTPLSSTNWIGTNAYTEVWFTSPQGTTNSTAIVARGALQ